MNLADMLKQLEEPQAEKVTEKVAEKVAEKVQELVVEATAEVVEPTAPVVSVPKTLEEYVKIVEAQGINPPPAPVSSEVPEPEGRAELVAGHNVVRKVVVKTVVPTGKTACPACGKFFKSLARHNCKALTVKVEDKVIENVLENDVVEMTTEGEVAVNGEAVPVVEPEVVEKAPAPVVEPEVVPTEGYTLCIDCLPTNGGKQFDFSEITQLVSAEYKVTHWSQIEYGKGGGALSLAAERYLVAVKPRGFLCVSSVDSEYKHVATALKKYAANIIVGVK